MSKLYVIGWDPAGPVKVGISQSPEKRLDALQTACPYKLQLLAVGSPTRSGQFRGFTSPWLERRIHRLHAPARLEGEWFSCSVDEVLSTDLGEAAGGRMIVWQKSDK